MTLIKRGADKGNLLLQPDRLAMEALFRLRDPLIFPRLAGRPMKYNKYFETHEGNKISIKRAFRGGVVKGRTASDADVVPMIDQIVELYLDQRFHFRMDYTDEDLTLDLTDFGDRYLGTECEELAYMYNIAGANEIGNALFYQFGTPGNGATTQEALLTRARMTKVAIPDNDRVYMVAGPMDVARISHDVKMVQHEGMVSQAIRRHYKGYLADMHLFSTNFIPQLVVPSQSGWTPVVDSSQPATGGKIVKVSGFDNANRRFLNKGNIITLAGVGEIHPRGDRQPTGRVAQFVVTADVEAPGSSSGVVDVPIYPELNSGTMPVALGNRGLHSPNNPGAAGGNKVYKWGQTVTALPATGASVNVIGKAAGNAIARYEQVLCFERSALEYVHVRLQEFDSAVWSANKVDPQTMVAISLLKGFDVKTREEITRGDIIFGVKTVYPEVGGRWITASATG